MSGHPRFARYAAPAAFLLVVTIAVLLVRSALHSGTKTGGGRTSAVTTQTTPHRHHKAHHHPHVVNYTVQSGDTLGSIAVKYHTTIARLQQLNPNVSPTALQVGQTIRVR